MRGWCISPGLRCDWNHEGGRGTDLGHHTAHTTPERSGENAGSEAINHPRWVTRKYPKKTTKDTIIQSRKRIIAPPFGKSFTPGPLGTVTAQSQHSDRRWFVSFFFFFQKSQIPHESVGIVLAPTWLGKRKLYSYCVSMSIFTVNGDWALEIDPARYFMEIDSLTRWESICILDEC